MKRPLQLLLAFLLIFVSLCAVACAGETDGSTPTDAPTDAPTTEGTTDESPDPGSDYADYLILASGGQSAYTLVYSSSATFTQKNITKDWVADPEKLTGASVPRETDKRAAVGAYEIVFAAPMQRQFVDPLMEACSWMGYSITVSEERIIVCAYSNEMYKKAANKLFAQVKDLGGGVYGIARDFTATYCDVKEDTLPKFDSAAGTLLGNRVYFQGNGNYVVGFGQVTEAEVDAYLAKLTAGGYEKLAENRAGSVRFATWRRGALVVYSNWNTTDKTFKLTVGNDTYLPESDEGTVEALVTPSLVQLAREGAKDTAPGMSYVLQLADGRYIIVDGGNSNAADEQVLLDYLVANKPSSHEKPVIALWMITHAHGDHAGLAVDLLNDHGSEIVLETVAHNFTDMDRNSVTNKDIDNTYAVGFLAAARKAAPSVQVWVVHSGQKVTIGGAEIEILYTPEDYFPNQIDWGNDTSCSWMITVGGKKVFFTGDSDPILCNDMARWYGSEGLQCDILQVTHHGFNGATEAFYRAIDPKICLWSCDATRFASDPRCLGTQSGYEFNQILRNEGWTRGDESGAREHHHCGETYTYNFA